MHIFIYFTIALIATTLGAISGMGGGVIMKPVLDLMGDYPVATVSVLSSITVFSMAVVSIIRHKQPKGVKLNVLGFVLLGVGAVIGGFLGQFIFEIIKSAIDNSKLAIIQNTILLILVLVVFFYMIFSDKIKGKDYKHPLLFCLTGIALGIISSFLGIGGGPFNVAAIMLLFSFDIKISALASICVILFSQATKILTIIFTTGFAQYNLSILPYMIVAAIIGAFLGSFIKSKSSDKTVKVLFNFVQIIIMIICISNIIIAAGVL